MSKVIEKKKLAGLLGKLSKYEVFGPTESGGSVRFARLDSDPELDFDNSKKPPKEVFFPQTERMFDFAVKDHVVTGVNESDGPAKPLLLLGARPCDTRAMLSLDRLFNWDYKDPYYDRRRDKATVISFACARPASNCFCTSMGGNPAGTDGADMLWTDIGASYLVESLSDKGAKVEKAVGKLFGKATEKQIKAADKVKQEAENSMAHSFDPAGAREALQKSFDNEYWEELANRCLGCGICTFLCPTCHCFDINDITFKGRMWRERNWDTCQFAYYSIHASNHNPRPARTHRQRNRIYHKFLNMNERLGVPGCVGCGRCVANCPVNIDVKEVLSDIMEVA